MDQGDACNQLRYDPHNPPRKMITRGRAALAAVGTVVVLALAWMLAQGRSVRDNDRTDDGLADRAAEAADAELADAIAREAANERAAAAARIEKVNAHTALVLERVREIERALHEGGEDSREVVLDTLLADLVRLDPGAAGALAASWETGEVRDLLLQRTARLWAAVDPPGALEWTAQIEEPDDRMLAAMSLCYTLAETDPADAVRVARLLGVPESDAGFGGLVQTWAETDLLGALGWTLQQPADPSRDALLARVAVVQARLQPAQAAQMVMTQMSSGQVREAAMLDVMQQWAAQDVEAARNWVTRLHDADLRERVHDELSRMDGDPALIPAE